MHDGIHQDKADVHYHKNYLLKLNRDFFLCPKKKGTVNLEPKFLVSEKEGTKKSTSSINRWIRMHQLRKIKNWNIINFLLLRYHNIFVFFFIMNHF